MTTSADDYERSIEDIVQEAETHGFAALQDDEIRRYVAWKSGIAARDAEASARADAQAAALRATADAQRDLAQHAAERFDALLSPIELQTI